MATANAPITMKEALTLASIGIYPQFINFTHVTMESDKYTCVREAAPQNSVDIIDMSMPMQPLRRPISADSALMNPNSRILALKTQLPGTTQVHLQIFNIEMKAKMKSYQMPEQVVFWKWISPQKLALVTQTAAYHWSIEGESEPVKMFDRTANLRPQLVKGNMQLFSVDQQRSQSLEAHAASFATFKVPGNENSSTLTSFAAKSFNAGQITSKLHVIELGAQPDISKVRSNICAHKARTSLCMTWRQLRQFTEIGICMPSCCRLLYLCNQCLEWVVEGWWKFCSTTTTSNEWDGDASNGLIRHATNGLLLTSLIYNETKDT